MLWWGGKGWREGCIIYLTSAVLRLECSLDCVSGSVGHQHHSYRLLYHSQRFL